MSRRSVPAQVASGTTHLVKLTELAVAAPQVVAHRLTRMALAGASPSERDRREFTGMVMEKQVAFMQSWMAMWVEGLRWQQAMALSWLTGASVQQHLQGATRAATRIASGGLAPVHRKAVANAKRLAGTRLR